MKRLLVGSLLTLVGLFPAHAQNEDLSVLVDAGDNMALITAIQNANTGAGPSLIFIRPSASGDLTFTFSMPFEGGESALPAVNTNRRISIFPFDSQGARISFVRDSNASQFRLFDVQDGELEIERFNIESFSVDGDGGAVAVSGDARLTLRSTNFRNNFASGAGGAISVTGNAALFSQGRSFSPSSGPVEFFGNRAGNLGGAVSITGNATGTIRSNIFADNAAGVFGCDINVQSASSANFGRTLILADSSFAADCDNVLIENPRGQLLVRNNTFGGRGDVLDTTDTVVFFANLFGVTPTSKKQNPKAICNDFGVGTVVSNGFNIEATDSCSLTDPTDRVNVDPGLADPDSNGVIALTPTSPAIDGGASQITNPVDGKFGLPCGYRDARGLGRPQDANLDGIYECDSGNYEVQGGPDIGPAQSGAYFDPSRNGEGAFVEMIGGDQAFVAEFTYETDGSGPAWFVGIGNVVNNSIVVDEVLQPTGGTFGASFDPDAIVRPAIGAMSMVFSNCSAANSTPGKQLFESNSDTAFSDLLVDAARLSTIVDCQNGAGPRSGRSGSFFDAERSGEGIFVQWLNDGQVIVIWYTFDPQGNQFWTISGTATVNGASVTADMLYPASVTSFGEAFDADEIDLQPWGTVTLQYNPGCDSMTFSYASTVPGFGSGSYEYTRLTSLAGTTCDL